MGNQKQNDGSTGKNDASVEVRNGNVDAVNSKDELQHEELAHVSAGTFTVTTHMRRIFSKL